MYLGTGGEGENHSYNGVYDSIIGKSKTEWMDNIEWKRLNVLLKEKKGTCPKRNRKEERKIMAG